MCVVVSLYICFRLIHFSSALCLYTLVLVLSHVLFQLSPICIKSSQLCAKTFLGPRAIRFFLAQSVSQHFKPTGACRNCVIHYIIVSQKLSLLFSSFASFRHSISGEYDIPFTKCFVVSLACMEILTYVHLCIKFAKTREKRKEKMKQNDQLQCKENTQLSTDYSKVVQNNSKRPLAQTSFN